MRTYDELKAAAYGVIESEKDELFELNKWIFDKKELSCQEYETSAKLVETLRSKGFTVEYPYAGLETAFFAAKPTGTAHGRKIAILTEYDALPGVGHACGHCLSGSISLLAGLALIGLQDDLDADIHVIGTPGEETDGAKGHMVDMGIFNDYDMAMMVHLNNYNMIVSDVVAITPIEYRFHGKAAHAAAAPWDGVNAFNAGQLFFHAVDMMRQHIKPECRIHGIFHEPGEAVNVVPDNVSLRVYIRSLDKPTQDDLVRRVDDCAKGAAIATQCTWEKSFFEHGYDPFNHNMAGSKVLEEIYGELGLPLDAPNSRFGSTDAGNVSWVCPTFHPLLEVVPHEISIHQKDFANYMCGDAAYKALEDGAKIITLQVLKIFTDPEKFAAMKEEFERTKA